MKYRKGGITEERDNTNANEKCNERKGNAKKLEEIMTQNDHMLFVCKPKKV